MKGAVNNAKLGGLGKKKKTQKKRKKDRRKRRRTVVFITGLLWKTSNLELEQSWNEFSSAIFAKQDKCVALSL